MIPVANIEQMRECDRMTIEELGLPGMVLMENASRAVATVVRAILTPVDPNDLTKNQSLSDKVVWIFCGKGNNGGDGFATARHMSNAGMDVKVILLGTVDSLKGDARTNADAFIGMEEDIQEVEDEDDLFELIENSFMEGEPNIIVDALLGTGFQGTVKGLYAEVIELINDFGVPVVAVDIPSGVESNTGTVNGPAVEAVATATFGLPKPGLLLSPGRDYSGEVIIAEIGIPPNIIRQQNIKLFQTEESDARSLLPHRDPAAHKGDVGHVFILAGSPGLTGAAVLSAEAAMRCGAGLTMVGVPQSLNAVLEAKLTESMTLPLPDNSQGYLTADGFDIIKAKMDWAHCIAIGPGIGRDDDTAELIGRILDIIDKPLVIDADGLNILADHPELLKKLSPDTVLTPHPGEFARLTGLTVKEILADKIEIVRHWAKEWGVTVMLKGSPSITVLEGGNACINPTGNAGMATGGSGDVLTGIIASLAAQGSAVDDAALMGAYIHGEAGDRAAEKMGQAGMIAGDIIAFLPETMEALS
ncbi:MAG: NAD(P)H-hydrate dehydratase [Candidatus Electryoneaceae bacterium]|nr:NAD(P)H-hydrate dehydratase [Candidatus Electryoneaceae bacterium]